MGEGQTGEGPISEGGGAELELVADCGRCAALCCVAPVFAKSADFPIDKAAGAPCPNLGDDRRCRIHTDLRARGFRGCAAFECFGAGQRVSQRVFAGRDWRADPALAGRIFQVFFVLYGLHGLLWHLDAALALPVDAALRAELAGARSRAAALADRDEAGLRATDPAPLRAEVNGLLLRASAQARRAGGVGRQARAGKQLLGARLRGADLRGADLFAALMIGADLQGADLRGADLRGADLRGADLRGADLRDALFLTRAQLGSARGDGATRLSAPLEAPEGWGR